MIFSQRQALKSKSFTLNLFPLHAVQPSQQHSNKMSVKKFHITCGGLTLKLKGGDKFDRSLFDPQAVDSDHRLLVVHVGYGHAESAVDRVESISHLELEAIHLDLVASRVYILDLVSCRQIDSVC